MKGYRKELWFNPPTRVAFINITSQVQKCLRESGVSEGFALVNAMHITASVFINDDERGLTMITVYGWKNWPRMNRSAVIVTTTPARTMPMRT